VHGLIVVRYSISPKTSSSSSHRKKSEKNEERASIIKAIIKTLNKPGNTDTASRVKGCPTREIMKATQRARGVHAARRVHAARIVNALRLCVDAKPQVC
jgi:hypothetical protein